METRVTTITKDGVEAAALEWLAAVGWRVAHGADIAPDTPGPERGPTTGRWSCSGGYRIPWPV